MSMRISYGTTPDGLRVEYRQYPNEYTSLAESRAKVFVSGKCVLIGWSSDGTTYDHFAALIKGEQS